LSRRHDELVVGQDVDDPLLVDVEFVVGGDGVDGSFVEEVSVFSGSEGFVGSEFLSSTADRGLEPGVVSKEVMNFNRKAVYFDLGEFDGEEVIVMGAENAGGSSFCFDEVAARGKGSDDSGVDRLLMSAQKFLIEYTSLFVISRKLLAGGGTSQFG
jgi:hypothetical protein